MFNLSEPTDRLMGMLRFVLLASNWDFGNLLE